MFSRPLFVAGVLSQRSTYVIPLITFLSSWSKNSLQVLLPPSLILSISCALKASIVILLTKLICTPNPRWMPAQTKQMKTPNLGEAHCGEGAPQSMHRSLPFVLDISRSWIRGTLSIRSCVYRRYNDGGSNGCRNDNIYLWSCLRINLPHSLWSHLYQCRSIKLWLFVCCLFSLSKSYDRGRVLIMQVLILSTHKVLSSRNLHFKFRNPTSEWRNFEFWLFFRNQSIYVNSLVDLDVKFVLEYGLSCLDVVRLYKGELNF